MLLVTVEAPTKISKPEDEFDITEGLNNYQLGCQECRMLLSLSACVWLSSEGPPSARLQREYLPSVIQRQSS